MYYYLFKNWPQQQRVATIATMLLENKNMAAQARRAPSGTEITVVCDVCFLLWVDSIRH